MAASHTFVVDKGETWVKTISATIDGSAVNHTGYTVEMDVRSDFNSSSELLTLTAGNGRVSINGSGNIVLTLAASVTSSLSFERGVYDLKVTSPGGTVNYYLRGPFVVARTVTR